MNAMFLRIALCATASLMVAAVGAEPVFAQQTVTFLCNAPAGHVCQFAVKTAGEQMGFALPAGQRKEVPGITPHADKYCVCDPGPVTPDCKAPELNHWCMGQWLDVDAGLNSDNDNRKALFAGGAAQAQ